MRSRIRNDVLAVGMRIAHDMCWLLASYTAACILTPNRPQPWYEFARTHGIYLAVFVIAWFAVALDQRLFVSRRIETLVSVLSSSTKVLLGSLLLAAFLLALILKPRFDRSFFLLLALSTVITLLLFTLIAQPSVWGLRRRGYNFRRILLVGANERAYRLAEVLSRNEHYGYQIVGFLEDDPARHNVLAPFGIPYLGPVRALDDVLMSNVVDVVYVVLSVQSSYETIQNVAHLCEGIGVPVRLMADLFPLRLATGDTTSLGNMPLLSLRVEPRIRTWFALRRAGDLVVSFLLFVLLLPLFCVIAVLIKLDSRGPIFCLQTHLGRGLKPFRVLSFRVHGIGPRLNSGLTDPRVPRDSGKAAFTRVGKYLRRYNLDELPQILNVFLGHSDLGSAWSPVLLDEPKQEAGQSLAPQAYSDAGHGEISRQSDRQDGAAEIHLAPSAQRASHFGALALGLADTLGVVFAYALAVCATEPSFQTVTAGLAINVPYLLVFLIAWYGAAIDARSWWFRATSRLTPHLAAVVRAVGYATVISISGMALLTPEGLPRRFLVCFCTFTLADLVAVRVLLRFLSRVLWRRGHFLARAVIIGVNERTKHLLQAIGPSHGHGYAILGLLEEQDHAGTSEDLFGLPLLGSPGSLERVLQARQVEEVFVTLPVRSHYDAIGGVISSCERAGVPVHIAADLLPMNIAKSRPMHIEDIPLVSLSPISEAYIELAIKRALDFLISSVLILILSPLFVLVAICIKLDSKGPVFFTQQRVGQNQRRFKILKFRSMVANAAALQEALESLNEADGPVFKIRNDPRITRVGRRLRRFSIDELPQIFNVWLGQMSLVGPRPPIPAEVDKYTWSQRRRLSVRPGITGLWQVSGRSDIPFSQWVEMDLTYIDSWSLWLDFLIVLKTFAVVASGRGAA
jgi:exopolysaccharide biosynthesis polyprenyl glycosylphosphotransferase